MCSKCHKDTNLVAAEARDQQAHTAERDAMITLGDPDQYGRREGWICGSCGHRSPGNLNGWGCTACQACGVACQFLLQEVRDGKGYTY